MSDWRMKDARRDVVLVDIDELVPKDHLLRKIETERICFCLSDRFAKSANWQIVRYKW